VPTPGTAAWRAEAAVGDDLAADSDGGEEQHGCQKICDEIRRRATAGSHERKDGKEAQL
jgi:hypothetical protein